MSLWTIFRKEQKVSRRLPAKINYSSGKEVKTKEKRLQKLQYLKRKIQ